MYWSQSGIYANNNQQGVSLSPSIQFGPDKTFLILGWDFFYDQVDFTSYTSASDDSMEKSNADLSRITTGPYAFTQYELPANLTISSGTRYESARTKNDYVEYDFINPTDPPTINHPIFGFPIPNPGYDPNAKLLSVIDQVNSYDGTVSKDGWAAELGLNWQPAKSVSVWTRYSRVYRYPALDETAAYQGFPLSDPLNENLNPEQGNNFEVGTKYDDGKYLLSLTGFCLLLDDEIVYDDTTNLNLNIGPTERWGAETEAGYRTDLWGSSVRCTFVDARFADGPNDGNTVPLVPWANGTASAWIQPAKWLRLTGY
jgi:iron complex outermembrane receptor protein